MGWVIGHGNSFIFRQGGGQKWSSYWTTLISATVEQAAPTNVVLTFPTAKPALGASDFTIAGFTISSASWTGAVLTLALSTAVNYGDSVVVTFVKTGGTYTATNNVTHPLVLENGHYKWFAADDLTTITKDGSNNVSAWKDKLSVSTISQETPSNQPLWVAPGIIKGNGSSAFMQSATAFFTGANARSIYVLYRNVATGSYNTPVCGQATGTTARTWFVIQERTLSVTGAPYLACYGDDLGNGLTVPDNDWKVALADYDGTTARLYKNNELVASGDKTLNTVNDVFKILRDQTGTYGNAEIAEIIVGDRADSDVDRTIINNYLNARLFFLMVYDAKIAWLDGVVEADVTAAKQTITEAGAFNGLTYTAPGGFTNAYIRDIYYVANAGYIENAEILNTYNWFKSKTPTTGANAYWVPDFIQPNGTVKYFTDYSGRGSRAAIDDNAFMLLLAINYYNRTGDAAFIRGELPFLEALMINSSYSDNLPYTPDADPFVGWGFYDQIKITGKLAMVGVLFYDSCKKLNDICVALSVTGYSFGTIATNIKNVWATTFWDGAKVSAGTVKCVGQFDITAAAYAVESGLVTGATATAITSAILTYLSDIEHKGFFRYVPSAFHDEVGVDVWEANFVNAAYGGYQDGGYWTIVLPHLIDAISKSNKQLARLLLANYIKYYEVFDMPECITVADAETNTSYCATGASIKTAINKLL